jgi:hypothetical protein
MKGSREGGRDIMVMGAMQHTFADAAAADSIAQEFK